MGSDQVEFCSICSLGSCE